MQKTLRFNNLNGSCLMNDDGDDVRRAPFIKEIVSLYFSVFNLSHSRRYETLSAAGTRVSSRTVAVNAYYTPCAPYLPKLAHTQIILTAHHIDLCRPAHKKKKKQLIIEFNRHSHLVDFHLTSGRIQCLNIFDCKLCRHSEVVRSMESIRYWMMMIGVSARAPV